LIQFQHVDTGENYLMLSKVKIKCLSTREWLPGFAYIKQGNPDNIYVRYAHDFKKKFKAVGTSFDIGEFSK